MGTSTHVPIHSDGTVTYLLAIRHYSLTESSFPLLFIRYVKGMEHTCLKLIQIQVLNFDISMAVTFFTRTSGWLSFPIHILAPISMLWYNALCILLSILKKSGNLFFLMCININQVGVARLLFFFSSNWLSTWRRWWFDQLHMIEWMHGPVPKCSLTQNKRIIQNKNWLNWKFINTFIFLCTV